MEINLSVYVCLTLTSIGSWFFSTVAGGGSSLILMPVIGSFLGAQAIPPVTTVGGIFGNCERVFVFRDHIRWDLIAWEFPGSISGACLGAFTLTMIHTEWLSLAIGIFLLASAANYVRKNYFFPQQESSFQVRPWYFLPGGFIYALLSGILGSMGPILAPFYLNYGLTKEELLATQAANRAVIHMIKVFAYAYFGILTLHDLSFGLLVGLAAFPGNWLGHRVLAKISEQRFKQLVISFVAFSGLLMLWEQHELLGF